LAEQIYAFLAGGVVGVVVMFLVLACIGVNGTDPDQW